MMNGNFGGGIGNMMGSGGSWLPFILGGLFILVLIVGIIALFIWKK